MNHQRASGYRKSYGYQRITSLSSAVALTWPPGARAARIVPETQAVRWRDDGVDPTATIGMPIAAGGEFIYAPAGDKTLFKVIEQTSAAVLNVHYTD